MWFAKGGAHHSVLSVDLFLTVDVAVSVKDSYGPIGRDVDSVIAAARILLDGAAANAIDPLIAPLPFNDQVTLHVIRACLRDRASTAVGDGSVQCEH